jgi:hypothetical protein
MIVVALHPTPRRPLASLRAVLTLALAVAGATGCRSHSAAKELDTLRSWTATVRLAAAERSSGAITERYASQIQARATTARQAAASSLARSAAAGDGRQTRAALDSLDAALRGLAGATEVR